MLDETKLFDFVKIMFTKPEQYNNIKNHSKKRHHFMINRFFAIKYPSNANLFNLNGINGGNVVESWAMVAQRFKGVPRWFYTKTKKAPKKQVDRYTPNDASIEIYLSKNEIGMREFNDLKLYAKEELFNDLQKIEAQIDVYRK
tara:strand:+ start:123 stop:551 length:429 start_codon:yes stop_codon:yes gene_type:complete